MPSHAINAYEKQARTFSEWVWYETNAALSEGEAVCYNWDYGTDTDADGRRLNRVETPSTTNAQWFAGVAARDYTAKSTGQLIEINNPGSVCNILCGKDTNTVVGVGLLTFDVTTGFKGEFRYAGLPGAGSAQPLQTTTGDASLPGLCLALLQVGPQSGGVEVVPLVANNAIGTLMIGGTTLITGSAIAGGSCTYILADPTVVIDGLRKRFDVITAEITTSDFVITVTTGRLSDATALQTITWTAGQTHIGFGVVLQWLESWNITGLGDGEPDIA